MIKYTMTGIQALNNFWYENGALRMWRVCDDGGEKFSGADQVVRFGTPQGPIRSVTMESFSNPNVEAGGYLHPAQMSEPGPSRELPSPSQAEEES